MLAEMRIWARSSLQRRAVAATAQAQRRRVEHASMLEGLAKARHPAAKAATQTPAKQEVAKKRSCNAGKPISIRTNEEENASLHPRRWFFALMGRTIAWELLPAYQRKC